MKKADIGVALYLLAAVIFFIVPISSTLLDVMIAINISIALIILFNTLFVKEVLDMSFFPTLLLFTTIFRISLNVSSTRLILSTGAPGNVVTTFGQFVGGGDLVIGAIIFIVLIIIQFVVINKGSERVAEVTARFTLDAMPGKQMAIDADLNTGAITEKEARERRNKIQEAYYNDVDGIVINPGAFTHYSYAVRDALASVAAIPKIEVHISNVHTREEFRHTSVTVPVCNGQVVGLGLKGYLYAMEAVVDLAMKK